MSDRKYEFTGVKNNNGLKQIRAVKFFGNIISGQIGGWIQSEYNLSHDGDSWVDGDAQVEGNAQVYGNAQVFGKARVTGNAQVFGKARVTDNAQVYGDAWVYGDARVTGNAQVYGDAWVYGNAHVTGNAQVYGDAEVYGDAWVYGDARVHGNEAFCSFSKFGSEHRTTTAFKDSVIGIRVVCGCFTGSLEDFRSKVVETHADNKHAKLYLMMADMIALKLQDNAQ